MSAAVACDPNETGKCSNVYTTSKSPDGRFLVEVRRCEMRYAAPGQGGDAPGIVWNLRLEVAVDAAEPTVL